MDQAKSKPITALDKPRRESRSSGATTSIRPRAQAPAMVMPTATAPVPDPTERLIVGQAGVRGAVRRSGGSKNVAATAMAMEIPPTIRKGAANESRSAVTPPSAGPAIEPALVAPRATPIASPLRPGRARSETRASAAIQLAADPTPWMTRPSISGQMDSDAAITPEPAAASTSPAISRPLRPTESARRPSGSERRTIGTA